MARCDTPALRLSWEWDGGEGGSVDRVNQLQACFCCRPPGPTMGGRMLPRPSSSSDRLQPAATSLVLSTRPHRHGHPAVFPVLWMEVSADG
ncbi:hypothetical protein AUP68_12259 [Ilyonectria robusta]